MSWQSAGYPVWKAPEANTATPFWLQWWHIFHALGLWQQLIPEISELLKKARG